MGLNIKNSAVEQLAGEVASLAGETKTEAIRRALAERRVRLLASKGKAKGRTGLRNYLESSVWPLVPEAEMGRALNREEEDKIFGYGQEGY
jgi:antitoxin VapB